MTKILVIVGTTRQGRTGRKVADWYMSQVENLGVDAEFELFDLAEWDLPLFNEPLSPMQHQYSELQNKLAEKISSADGFVFVTAEYNHGVPASLKNLIDYLNAEWAHKAVAYVGYGGIGAARAIEHLIQIMVELRAVNVRDQVRIHEIWGALDENGAPKEGFVHGDVKAQIDELLWLTNALKSAK